MFNQLAHNKQMFEMDQEIDFKKIQKNLDGNPPPHTFQIFKNSQNTYTYLHILIFVKIGSYCIISHPKSPLLTISI